MAARVIVIVTLAACMTPTGRLPATAAESPASSYAAGFFDEAWRVATTDRSSAGGRELLRAHCGACHFDGAEEGGLAIDGLLNRLADRPTAAGGPDQAAWMSVLRNLRAETMPPADEPRPSADDRTQLIGFVERDAFGLDPARPDPGRVVLRRLNRAEYTNTIRDLVGLDADVAEDLPSDDTGYGFDTIGDVLSMSPLLVEKYMALAGRVGEALVEEARPAKGGSGDHAYPAGVRRMFPLGPPPDEGDSARAQHLRQTVTRLAERAFRRPVDEATIDRLCGVARTAIEAPDGTFERGIAAALTAALASPRFLFRLEKDHADRDSSPPTTSPTAVPLDEYALASRLSYFLWSSMPDDELLHLARQGRLHAELGPQVERLIADSRSDRFVADFVGQWLQTRDVENLPFDLTRVLESKNGLPVRHAFAAARIFSPRVRLAMRRETELFFAHLLRENRPATDLLVARETFLNGSLARFYGIPDVEGPDMRLVSLDPDSHRGGLLTHGSLLAVTSNPTRTSPVKRGLFILDNLLGTPPPPPPPDVPPLEAAAPSTEGEPSMRELMERHRHDALCASCHARMDPLGLALERYNAIGQWRSDADDAIDTRGQLITGESFADARELAAVIAGPRRHDFQRCLAEKLLTYALGRGLEYFDGPAVDRIGERLDHEGGGLGTLVQGVCESVPFRMQRPATVEEQDP